MVNSFQAKAMAHAGDNTTFIEMVTYIVKYYKKHGDDNKVGKITFTLPLWQEMSKKEIFRKKSLSAHALSKQLKKARIVSASSILYPPNIKFISANPLSGAFVHAKFDSYDKVLDYRDTVIQALKSENLDREQKLLYLYIYLRVFHLEQIPLKFLKEINIKNVIWLPKKLLLVFVDNTEESFKQISIFIPDDVALNSIKDMTLVEDEPLFFDVEDFESAYRETLNTMLPNLTLHHIRQITQLEYQLHTSPLELTLQLQKQYPKLHLHEIEHIFEGYIPKELLAIESQNLQTYRKHSNTDDEFEEEGDEEHSKKKNYLYHNLEMYEALKSIKEVPFEPKELAKYLTRWYNFIEKNSKKEKEGYLFQILQYCQLLLYKADKNYKRKPILASTLKEYLRILFQYAFKYIVTEGTINDSVIKNIEIGILYNDGLTLPSQRKYKRLINNFLKNMTSYDTLSKIKGAISMNRSIVFKNEIDELVELLIKEDKVGVRTGTKMNLIKTYERAVFTLLLYYSGARKEELRRCLTSDIVSIGAKTFILDINKDGLRKQKNAEYNKGGGLKSTAAKRRVRFNITDTRYLEIIKSYITNIEKHGTLFLFPKAEKKVYKKQLISESSIAKISLLLQGITKRFTPLHALRHAFATNQVKYILTAKGAKIEDIFELSNQIGHSSPEVTLEFYVHIGLLQLMGVMTSTDYH